jgi:hypothetical protein
VSQPPRDVIEARPPKNLVVLMWALAAASCGAWQEPPLESASAANRGPRDHADDGDLASLVPVGVETLIEVDLAALRKSPWTQEALIDPDEKLRERKAVALGYDGTADVDRIVYAVTSAGSAAPTVVIAQGRFQIANVEAAFRDRWPGAAVDKWRGSTTLVSGESALGSVTARTFCSGTLDEVHAVIDRAFGVGGGFLDDQPGAGQGALRRELLALARETAPGVLATVVIGERLRARVGDTLPLPRELRQVGARLDVGQTLDLQAVGMLDNREAAAAMARRVSVLLNAWRTRLALGALGLSALVGAVQVSADGAAVRVHARVGAEHRAEISAALAAIMKAVRGPDDPRGSGSW